jgi:hypothetical protein
MFWKTEDPGGAPDFSAIVGMDPYANWVLNQAWSEFSRCETDLIIPFVVALLSDATVAIMESNSEAHGDSNTKLLPILIPQLNPPIKRGNYISAFARRLLPGFGDFERGSLRELSESSQTDQAGSAAEGGTAAGSKNLRLR